MQVLYLTILVTNQGVAQGENGTATKDGFEWVMGVNHLSHFLLTSLLFQRIKETSSVESVPCRIVNVSSKAHLFNSKYDWDAIKMGSGGGYGLSKLAQIHFTRQLAIQIEKAGLKDKIHVYALHPGVVSTNIWKAVPWILSPLAWVAKKFMISEEEGASTTL